MTVISSSLTLLCTTITIWSCRALTTPIRKQQSLNIHFSSPPSSSSRTQDGVPFRRQPRMPNRSNSGSNGGTYKRHGGKPRASSKGKAMYWVIESCYKSGASPELMSILLKLYQARTPRQILQSSSKIPFILSDESFAVRERVLKVTSMLGLIPLSVDILTDMLRKDERLPSKQAYVELLCTLRKRGRLTMMREIMTELCEFENVDVVALNCYLGALCEDKSGDGSVKAAEILVRPEETRWDNRILPDILSFNIVLNAFSSSNHPQGKFWIDALFQRILLVNQNVSSGDGGDGGDSVNPDVYTFNALLRSPSNTKNDVMIILRQMKERNIDPDRFTIDYTIAPLLKNGDTKMVTRLLREFIVKSAHSSQLTNQACEAFFVTLVNVGQVQMAKDIFDDFWIRRSALQPTTRQFNILLAAYQNKIAMLQRHRHKKNTDISKDEDTARQGAHSLLNDIMYNTKTLPDEYTVSITMGLFCSQLSTSKHVSDYIHFFSDSVPTPTWKWNPITFHSIMKAYGAVADPSSAIRIFDCMPRKNGVKTYNALLMVLAKESNANLVLTFQDHADHGDLFTNLCNQSSLSAREIRSNKVTNSTHIVELVQGLTCHQASLAILDSMTPNNPHTHKIQSNSQTYCLVATALSHHITATKSDATAKKEQAMALFQNALSNQISMDGRFVNAIIQCFQDDVIGALDAWKAHIGRAVKRYQTLEMQTYETAAATNGARGGSGGFAGKQHQQHLKQAYHGLLTTCGKGGRPDIAVRLVYAMQKEGLEADEVVLGCFEAGKRWKLDRDSSQSDDQEREKTLAKPVIGSKRWISDQYESILSVECTKYNQGDVRRENDKRVRIII